MSVEKLKTMFASEDDAVKAQAIALAVQLEDEAVNRWVLEKCAWSSSAIAKEGGLVSEAFDEPVRGRLHYLKSAGFGPLNVLRIIARTPVDELRDVRTVLISAHRLGGRFPVPFDLSSLSVLEKLRALFVMGEDGYGDNVERYPVDVAGIKNTALDTLEIKGAASVDLAPLRDLKSLRSLSLCGCRELKNIDVLADLPLERLLLWGNTCPPVRVPTSLRALYLVDDEVANLSSLSALERLRAKNTRIDASEIKRLDHLEVVDLRTCSGVEAEHLVALKRLRMALLGGAVAPSELPEALAGRVSLADDPELELMLMNRE